MSQLPIVTKLLDRADRSLPAYHGFIKADIRKAARIIGALYEALDNLTDAVERFNGRVPATDESLAMALRAKALARGADAQAEGGM